MFTLYISTHSHYTAFIHFLKLKSTSSVYSACFVSISFLFIFFFVFFSFNGSISVYRMPASNKFNNNNNKHFYYVWCKIDTGKCVILDTTTIGIKRNNIVYEKQAKKMVNLILGHLQIHTFHSKFCCFVLRMQQNKSSENRSKGHQSSIQFYLRNSLLIWKLDQLDGLCMLVFFCRAIHSCAEMENDRFDINIENKPIVGSNYQY